MRVGKVDKRVLGPVLMGFFIMGFCDMVAPITGRIAAESERPILQAVFCVGEWRETEFAGKGGA